MTNLTPCERISKSSQFSEISADDCEIKYTNPVPIKEELKQCPFTIYHAISISDDALSPQDFVTIVMLFPSSVNSSSMKIRVAPNHDTLIYFYDRSQDPSVTVKSYVVRGLHPTCMENRLNSNLITHWLLDSLHISSRFGEDDDDMIKSVGSVTLDQGITIEKNIVDVLPPKYTTEITNAALVTLRRTVLDAYKETFIMPSDVEA